MARQNINIGTTANDGTGDTLRVSGQKINENFVEVYNFLGVDSDNLSSNVSFNNFGVVFEGTLKDGIVTELTAGNPASNVDITLPESSGEVIVSTAVQTLTNKTLTSPVLTSPQINDSDLTYQYIIRGSGLSADRIVTLPTLVSNDTLVFVAASQTLTNKSLTSPIVTTPSIVTAVRDANGANSIGITATTSAVNYLQVANAATGSGPRISATGSDTNINLNIASKGTGYINLENKLVAKAETIVASGSVSLNVPTTIFDAGGAISCSLGDGSIKGEFKFFINEGAAEATITPTNFSNGTSFVMRQNAATQAIWSGDNWHIITSKDYDSSDLDALIYIL